MKNDLDLAIIGTRWQEGHVLRRDTSTGFYEEINPPMRTHCERFVQQALLMPIKPRVAARINQILAMRRKT
jgi:hypothetical protein